MPSSSRGPQSLQSVPSSHRSNALAIPPSSHTKSSACSHEFEHSCAGDAGGAGGAGGDGGGGGEFGGDGGGDGGEGIAGGAGGFIAAWVVIQSL